MKVSTHEERLNTLYAPSQVFFEVTVNFLLCFIGYSKVQIKLTPSDLEGSLAPLYKLIKTLIASGANEAKQILQKVELLKL